MHETLQLLQTEFSIPEKWQQKIAALGEVELASSQFQTLLDSGSLERPTLAQSILKAAASG